MKKYMGQTTYYCEDHRNITVRADSPNIRIAPVCRICFKHMYWVPSGGTLVPEVTPEYWEGWMEALKGKPEIGSTELSSEPEDLV